MIFDFMGRLLLRDEKPASRTIASRSSCGCDGYHKKDDFRHFYGFG